MNDNLSVSLKKSVVNARVLPMNQRKKKTSIHKLFGLYGNDFSPLRGSLLYADDHVELDVNDESIDISDLQSVTFSVIFRSGNVKGLPSIIPYISIILISDDLDVELNTDDYKNSLEFYECLKKSDIKIIDEINIYDMLNESDDLYQTMVDKGKGITVKYNLEYPTKDSLRK